MRRFAGRLSTAVTALVLAGAVATVGYLVVAPRVIGGATLTVLSGSMSPTIPQGAVVLIRPVDDLEGIEPGTVITYQKSPSEQALVTHRVLRFQPETTPSSYITKGDANRGEDSDPVPVGAIRGEVIAHVPYLGRISDFLGGPRGPYLLMVIGAAGVIVTQGRKLVAALRDGKTEAGDGPPEPPEGTTDGLVTADVSMEDRP